MEIPGGSFTIDYLLMRPDPIKKKCLLSNVFYQRSGFTIKQTLTSSDQGMSNYLHPTSTKAQPLKRKTSYLSCSSSADNTTLSTTQKRKCDLTGVTFEDAQQQRMDPPTPLGGHPPGTEICPSDHWTRRLVGTGYHGLPCLSTLTGSRWYSINDISDEVEDCQDDAPKITPQELEVTHDGVSIFLQDSDLWYKFHKEGTEMIINRTGRRMFPRIAFRLTGLDPSASYNILLVFHRSDRCRYKFINGKWHSTEVTEFHERRHEYIHPESPKTGDLWMKTIVNFSKLKITNNPQADGEKVFLQSMYKYIPHIVIVQCGEKVLTEEFRQTPSTTTKFPSTRPRSYKFNFPLTTFIAVTAYQNEKITYLKIKNNPFAKAFRESDRNGSSGSSSGIFGLFRRFPKEKYPLCSLQNAKSAVNITSPLSTDRYFRQMMYSARSLTHLPTNHSGEETDVITYKKVYNILSGDSVSQSLPSFWSFDHLRPFSSNTSLLSEDDSAYGSSVFNKVSCVN